MLTAESELLRAAVARAVLRPDAVPPPTPSLVAAAAYHGVVAPLQRSYSGFPSDPSTKLLRSSALRARGIALALTRAAGDVSRWLAEAEIRHAVVKGPALAVAYPDADRTFVDLDILVHPHNMNHAIGVLQRHGGRVLDDLTWPRGDGVAELTVGLAGGVAVDLHADLIQHEDVRRCFRFPAAPLLDRLDVTEVLGVEIPVLDTEDALIHTALHAAVGGGHRLIWLADLDALVRAREVHWDVLIRRAREARLALVVGVMLQRTRLALESPVPEEVLAQLLHGGRMWALALVWFDRLRPAAASHRRMVRGQILVRATRHSTATSLAALARLIYSDVVLALINDEHHPWRHAWRSRRSRRRR